MASKVKPVPDGYNTVTTVLTLENCSAAIDWYKKALGAEEVMRHNLPDGKVMHALIKIGDTKLMVHDPMMDKSPKALGGSPASLWLYVADCDAAWKKAVAAGAKETFPLTDQFWGDRMGTLTDPHGYMWSIATHKEDVSPEEMKKRQEAAFKAFGAPKKGK